MITLIKSDSPLLPVFQQATENCRAKLEQVGDALFACSWNWSEIQRFVSTDLTASPKRVGVIIDTEGNSTIVPYDETEAEPQELSGEYFEELQVTRPELFFSEAVSEPQEEYRRRMSSNEFTTLLGDSLETAILTAAQSSIEIQKYVNRMGWATYVDLDDPWVLEGLTKLQLVGLVTQDDIDRIMLGIKSK